jgi:hypothetical protein
VSEAKLSVEVHGHEAMRSLVETVVTLWGCGRCSFCPQHIELLNQLLISTRGILAHVGAKVPAEPRRPTATATTSGSVVGPARNGNAASDQPSDPTDTNTTPARGPEEAGTSWQKAWDAYVEYYAECWCGARCTSEAHWAPKHRRCAPPFLGRERAIPDSLSDNGDPTYQRGFLNGYTAGAAVQRSRAGESSDRGCCESAYFDGKEQAIRDLAAPTDPAAFAKVAKRLDEIDAEMTRLRAVAAAAREAATCCDCPTMGRLDTALGLLDQGSPSSSDPKGARDG